MVFLHTLTLPAPPHLLCLTTLLSIIIFIVYTPMQGTDAVPLSPGGNNIEYKRYCSTSLSEAIRLICGGRFNSLSRTYPASVGTTAHRTAALKRFAPDDYVYRPQMSSTIHECCRRPCGYSDLKMYCAPD